LPENGSSITGSLKDEMPRKGVHLGSGILMAVAYWFFEKNVLVFIHLFFLLGIWFLELLRLKGAIQVPFLRNLERQRIDEFVTSQHRCHCERPARHQLRFRRWQAGASPQGEAGGSEAISFNAST